MRKVCLTGILTLILFAFWSQEAKGDDVIITLSESKGMSEVWNFWRTNDFNRDELNRWYYCKPSNACKRGFADVIKEVNEIKDFRNLPVGYEIVIPDSLLEGSGTASEKAEHNMRSTKKKSGQSFKQHNTPNNTASENQDSTQISSLTWDDTYKTSGESSRVERNQSWLSDSTEFNYRENNSSGFLNLKDRARKQLQKRLIPKERLDSTIDVEEDRQVKRNNSKVNAGGGENESASQGIERSQKATTGWKKTESISSKEGVETTSISTAVIMQKWKQIKFAEKLYGGTLIFVLLLGLIEFFRS